MSEHPPPVARNSPCPCGSGRRYKDCHGVLGQRPAPLASPATFRLPAVPPRSSYRAPDPEWAHLSEAQRDRVGGLMERALAEQVAGRLTEAERAYREVLASAPDTHDALHMAGVIVLSLGDPDEAERLILAAMALRPAYPAIAHNLQLVRDAKLARERALPEELCERVLPLLAELALAPALAERHAPAHGPGSSRIHLIGRIDAGGDDDGRLLRRLAAILAAARPQVWATDGGMAPELDGRRVVRIDAAIGTYPRGGVHVFAGIGFLDCEWLKWSEADRIIVFCGGAPPSLCLDALRAIARDGERPIELVFATHALASRFGGIGIVLPPPLELPDAPPRTLEPDRPYGVWRVEEPRAWTAGVVGQNGRSVADPTDADFFIALAQYAGRLAIYDPGPLRFRLGANPSVRFTPRAREGPQSFLATLNCYCRRPGAWWDESDGRDLFVAMALGVPVLCPRSSSFAEYIDDRVDGLLYDSDDSALDLATSLRAAPDWAQEIGRAARAKTASLFDADALAQRYRRIVQDGGAAASIPAAARVA